MMRISALLLVAGVINSGALLAAEPCKFNDRQGEYEEDKAEQLTCLLRKTDGAAYIFKKQAIPQGLVSLVKKQRVDFSEGQLKKYLANNNVNEKDIGGDIATPLNKKTKYIVIHDTSTPVALQNNEFPSDINDEWSGNKLSAYGKSAENNAHVFINRPGQSKTSIDFSTFYRTTKFENEKIGRRYVFISVELIQPRATLPTQSGIANDYRSPVPGFTDAQLERLAIVYLAGSYRAGKYLLPAFHSVIDIPFKKGGHNDPLNFDLAKWSGLIDKVNNEISAQ
ncbi:hypothetical protein J2X14_000561 [Pantoea alhagi]|uniref:hypothetical protein n=1 Tax=Mixta sp. BE291 TaxID=3158787 RepID=UPI002864C648|nr:hypothetical protein [Pantoea alhagi]